MLLKRYFIGYPNEPSLKWEEVGTRLDVLRNSEGEVMMNIGEEHQDYDDLYIHVCNPDQLGYHVMCKGIDDGAEENFILVDMSLGEEVVTVYWPCRGASGNEEEIYHFCFVDEMTMRCAVHFFFETGRRAPELRWEPDYLMH